MCLCFNFLKMSMGVHLYVILVILVCIYAISGNFPLQSRYKNIGQFIKISNTVSGFAEGKYQYKIN